MLCDPDFKKEPDIEAIHHYLAYQSVPTPLTNLPAGKSHKPLLKFCI